MNGWLLALIIVLVLAFAAFMAADLIRLHRRLR